MTKEELTKKRELIANQYKNAIIIMKNEVAILLDMYCGKDKYKVVSESTRYINISTIADDDNVPSLEITFGFEPIFSKQNIVEKNEFYFRTNIPSVGQFDLFNENDRSYKYHKMISEIIFNKELLKKIWDSIYKMSTYLEKVELELDKCDDELRKITREENKKENYEQHKNKSKECPFVACFEHFDGYYTYKGNAVHIMKMFESKEKAKEYYKENKIVPAYVKKHFCRFDELTLN